MRHVTFKLSLFLGLMLLVGGNSLNAQQSVSDPLIHVQIYVAGEGADPLSSEPIHWFVQSGWLMNAGGEGIVSLGPKALSTLTTRLESLQNDPSVAKFEMDKAENKFYLTLKGKDTSGANALLEDTVKSEAKD